MSLRNIISGLLCNKVTCINSVDFFYRILPWLPWCAQQPQ